jgi:hypothetical protein
LIYITSEEIAMNDEQRLKELTERLKNRPRGRGEKSAIKEILDEVKESGLIPQSLMCRMTYDFFDRTFDPRTSIKPGMCPECAYRSMLETVAAVIRMNAEEKDKKGNKERAIYEKEIAIVVFLCNIGLLSSEDAQRWADYLSDEKGHILVTIHKDEPRDP